MVELKEDRYGEYGVPDVKRKGCKLCPVKFKLELLIDLHMFLMFEKSIQVGISQAVRPYANSSKTIW